MQSPAPTDRHLTRQSTSDVVIDLRDGVDPTVIVRAPAGPDVHAPDLAAPGGEAHPLVTAAHLREANLAAALVLVVLYAVELLFPASAHDPLGAQDLVVPQGFAVLALVFVVRRLRPGLRSTLALWALSGAVTTGVLVNLASF